MSSILNKSITPHGSHPIVGSQSSSQFRRPMKVVAGGHSSTESGYRSSQLGSEHKRLNDVLRFGNSDASKLSHLLPEGEICNFVPDQIAQVNPAKAFKMVPDEAVFERISLGFIWPLMENKQMSVIKDKVAGLDIFGTQSATDTLTVSVSSAMKLQRHQLDQIAKKMQRITGTARVSIKNTIDPSVIAGFVISYEKEGSHTIDLSVKGKLDKLAAHIESKDQSQLSSSGSYMFMNR
ncbi:ATP synthase delta chain, chloroplastic-like [Nymphaea colorata]|uniref:ATP synthase delta chain, chloroplastic n=1 Tax=Nymphaea colorata TaxID=210225 RepID=A0A5K1DA32_9MAGN|nr:ATP synthase delta chain, chloroplastic-like [Nymphaea colorata]XP_031485560.1 ATP synthase delta chain, chloroplastic-like [Nymphaea colorata]